MESEVRAVFPWQQRLRWCAHRSSRPRGRWPRRRFSRIEEDATEGLRPPLVRSICDLSPGSALRRFPLFADNSLFQSFFDVIGRKWDLARRVADVDRYFADFL